MIKLFAPLLVALVSWASTPLVLAQDYPNKALRLVVAYPPGASSDALARSVAQKMAQSMGQPVVVDNRAGASGNIGTEHVAKQAGDGYTFMLGTDATHAANMHLTATPSFHPIRDFTPLTLAALNPIVLVVNPAVPARTLRELVDYGRANPDKIAYGSSGSGSPHHLAGELLKQVSGVPFLHVPYKGGAQAVTDVLGGQIPMVFSSLITVLPHIRSGKLRAIAVTQATRYAGLPEVPTFAETLPGFEMNSWLGFFAPAGLPEAVTRRLNEELVKALRDPEVQPRLDAGGLIVTTLSPADFAAMVRKEYEQRGRLISAAGVKLQ
ncbi:MAG: tripartite tricarboxylate transporter substrate binding protein [Burkholderiaceae bacterium]|nr:tripartite tricarboxylate transporter substrate binding protein [Burkholderiaceae bacterium]